MVERGTAPWVCQGCGQRYWFQESRDQCQQRCAVRKGGTVMAGKYRSLGYYGGKRGYGLAEWIAGQLPWEKQSCYIEPFAGMAGVLLAREPVKIEILNDLNGRVINWWRAVRDEPTEFGRLTDMTVASREELRWACQAVDDPAETALRRALAFHILITQSVSTGDSSSSGGSWRRSFNPWKLGIHRRTVEQIDHLSARLRYVQLESTDALALLERTADLPWAVIYADPPYPSANTTPYALGELDYGRLGELLQAQTGAVAISGYPGEWDSLGWERQEKLALRKNINAGQSEPRVECLWRNARCVELTAARRLL